MTSMGRGIKDALNKLPALPGPPAKPTHEERREMTPFELHHCDLKEAEIAAEIARRLDAGEVPF